MKHLLSLQKLHKKEILQIITLAEKMKKSPSSYADSLKKKTLLMLFAKPSLRTHISFDIAMYELGGHALYYDLSTSPLGKKESFKDGALVISRYVDCVMARLYEHSDMEELALYSTVPVINGLDNLEHPCQVLGDLLTIKEKFGVLEGISLTYIGDAHNNVTHSLLYGCTNVGIKMIISCPQKKEFLPQQSLLTSAKKLEILH